MLTIVQENWKTILENMKQEWEISGMAYATWVCYFKPFKVEGDTLIVKVDKENLMINAYWFEMKYSIPLHVSIKNVLGKELFVKFLC